jgi:ferrous iron transport protein A
MTLAHLLPGQRAIIQAVDAEGLLLQRLTVLGLLPGTQIQAQFRGPGGDPIAYRVRGTLLALRHSTAQKIIICPWGGLTYDWSARGCPSR